MHKHCNPHVTIAAAVAAALMLSAAGQALATATSFFEPDAWTTGDANTTYQEWDTVTGTSGNTPDVGLSVNPSITTDPTLSAVAPGFVAGSGNFYAFSAPYRITADIYNHGGSSGTGGLPAGAGTHVIVQTSATLNEGQGIQADTLQIVDLPGNAIAGGDNAGALRHDVLFEGTVSSSMGPVTQREEIWEFFLPNYVGDFRLQSDVAIHSSFDQLRVDTAIGRDAFATMDVPEPATLALLAVGGALTLARRRTPHRV